MEAEGRIHKRTAAYLSNHATSAAVRAGTVFNQAVMQFWAVSRDDRALWIVGQSCVQPLHVCHEHQQVCLELFGKQASQAAS